MERGVVRNCNLKFEKKTDTDKSGVSGCAQLEKFINNETICPLLRFALRPVCIVCAHAARPARARQPPLPYKPCQPPRPSTTPSLRPAPPLLTTVRRRPATTTDTSRPRRPFPLPFTRPSFVLRPPSSVLRPPSSVRVHPSSHSLQLNSTQLILVPRPNSTKLNSPQHNATQLIST